MTTILKTDVRPIELFGRVGTLWGWRCMMLKVLLAAGGLLVAAFAFLHF
jgi:hypothetical protein